jgi:ATP-dependent DNA helicase RecG
VLGLLTLSPRARDFLPCAYVQFLRIAGRELSDPVVDDFIADGTLAETILRVEDKLASHNRRSVDFTSADIEVQAQPYPMPALQQLVRNAIMHRTYEGTNAPVRITWFDDRITIDSPGGPFGQVTAETFGKPGIQDYRNPGIAEALKVLGFVQRFGVGIPTARRLLEINGNSPPEFDVQPNHVAVTVHGAQ